MTGSTSKNRWFFPWLKEAQRALIQGDIRATTFTVLVVLSQYADYDSGRNARPGLPRLASDTGLSQRTVTDALRAGEQAGLIKQVRRGFGNPGSGTTSIYDMALQPRSTALAASKRPAAASAAAPASAPATNSALPRTSQDATDENKSHQTTGSPRRVQKPRQKPQQKIAWERVGLTREVARERGLTEVDFRNFLSIQEERAERT